MGESSTVDRLVAELHTGAPEEPGTFSVDAASADRKLRALRLNNPLHWVLVGLRGAMRAGASRIEAFEEDGDLVMQWPEPTELPTGDLLPTAALGSAGERVGLREVLLAAFIGINHGLREVSIASGARMLIVEAGSVREREIRPQPGTRLVAQGRLVPPLDGQRSELWVLRKRGRYLEVPLMVGGERASFGVDGQLDLDSRAIKLRGRKRRELLRAASVDADHGEIRLLSAGVWVDGIVDDQLPPGYVAVVLHDHDMDAGQARVVRDTVHLAGVQEARSRARKVRTLNPPPSERVVRRLKQALDESGADVDTVAPSLKVGVASSIVTGMVMLLVYVSRWTGTDGLIATLVNVLLLVVITGFAWGAGWHAVLEDRLKVAARLQQRSQFPPHHPGRPFVLPGLDPTAHRVRPVLMPWLTVALVAVGYVLVALAPGREATSAHLFGLPMLLGGVFSLVLTSMVADLVGKRRARDPSRFAEPPL